MHEQELSRHTRIVFNILTLIRIIGLIGIGFAYFSWLLRYSPAVVRFAMLESGWLLHPDTPPVVALASGFAYYSAGVAVSWMKLPKRPAIPKAAMLLAISIPCALVPLQSAVHSEMVELNESLASTHSERAVFSETLGLYPSPFTPQDDDGSWERVSSLQRWNSLGLGNPLLSGEPYSTRYAEEAQSFVAAGRVEDAKAASRRLEDAGAAGIMPELIQAKVAYHSGDTARALLLSQQARERADALAVSNGWRTRAIRVSEARIAYYEAARAMAGGDRGRAGRLLETYATLSRDAGVASRVREDPRFGPLLDRDVMSNLAITARGLGSSPGDFW